MTSPLLDRLAELERERDTSLPEDPRWDLLARGALSRAEVEELRAMCDEPHAARVFEAFTPLDGAARERLTSHVRLLVAPPPRAKVIPFPSARHDAAPATARQLAASPDRPPPLRSRRLALAGVLAFCAAAAAIGLLVRPVREPMQAAAWRPPVAGVPVYALEVSGGDTPGAVRSGPPAAAPLPAPASLLTRGAALALLLRPRTAAEQPVELRSCAVRDGRAEPWPAPWERSDRGAFHLEGGRDTLFPAAKDGEITLVLATGPEGALPSCEALAAAAVAPMPPANGVTVLVHRVILR